MSLFPRMSSSAFGTPAIMRHEFTPFLSLFNDTFNELQRLSDQFPSTPGQGGQSGASSFFAPKFDVKETSDAYTLEGELPGIAQKDLTIEFTDENTLTVKGRTETFREEGTKPSSSSTAKITAPDSQSEAAPDGSSAGPAAEKDGQGQATSGNTDGGKDNTQLTTQNSSTEVASNKNNNRHTYWITERSVGSFQRSFNFAPHRVDHDNVKASLKNGILSIVVPKLAPKPNPGSRKITIAEE